MNHRRIASLAAGLIVLTGCSDSGDNEIDVSGDDAVCGIGCDENENWFQEPEALAQTSPERLYACAATFGALSTNYYYRDCGEETPSECETHSPQWREAELTALAYHTMAQGRAGATGTGDQASILMQRKADHEANAHSIIADGGEDGQSELDRRAGLCQAELPIIAADASADSGKSAAELPDSQVE